MDCKNIIVKYLYDDGNICYCKNCLYQELDDDSNCEDCFSNYENKLEEPCEYHNSNLCYDCFNFDQDNNHILFKILEKIFINKGTDIFMKIKSIINVNIPFLLEKIMTSCLLNKNYEKSLIMLDLGANIDFDFKEYNKTLSNFTLIHYFFYLHGYDDNFMYILEKYKYNFDVRDHKDNTIMGTEIIKYLQSKHNSNDTIKKLLKIGYDLAYENFNEVSGLEYGGEKHYWRRKRVDWLIKKGICYWLNRCVKKSNHNNHSCKLLRDTRIGCYLNHLEVLKYIKN